MSVVNVITIEKNIPIPEPSWKGNSIKYKFIDTMEVDDSFYINGNTPTFNPVSVRAHVYKLNSDTCKRFTIRTLEGPAASPVGIRVWRIQ